MFNLMIRTSTMNSLNTTTQTDLPSQLLQLGLITTAQTVDDFIARATKGRPFKMPSGYAGILGVYRHNDGPGFALS
jgi:hypothetical protein